MNTPVLETERLILRSFTENDMDAIFELFGDEEMNTFLPWFPLKTVAEAMVFYESRFKGQYGKKCAYSYAICLKNDDYPIGYINVGPDDSRDLGYGLARRFRHKGIATEAGKAVVERLKKDGVSYITATHDIKNPKSGEVMKRLGMEYKYSYEERWQPKNFLVTFRMYQLNLDGNSGRVYKKYWDDSAVRFIERDI